MLPDIRLCTIWQAEVFTDGSTSATEKHDEGTNVVVRTEPTRKGYTFTGWTVEGLDVSTINSGDHFKMPGNTVKLTANWKAKNIEAYVTLTTKDVTEKYDGQPHQAGQATVAAKEGKDSKDIGNLKYLSIRFLAQTHGQQISERLQQQMYLKVRL